MDQEVAHIKPSQVYMVVYCRSDGSAAWQGAVGEGGVSRASGHGVVGRSGAGDASTGAELGTDRGTPAVPAPGRVGTVCQRGGDGAASASAPSAGPGNPQSSPARRLSRKVSVGAGSPMLREASTPERLAKARRLGDALAHVEEVAMDSGPAVSAVVGLPSARDLRCGSTEQNRVSAREVTEQD